MEVAAFWIALGAVIVAAIWEKTRTEAMRHETLRTLIEKDGTLDVEQVKEVLNPPRPPLPMQKPGYGYRLLRVNGAVMMISAVGVGAFAAVIATIQNEPDALAIGIGFAILVVLVGLGLFVGSRFLARPPDAEDVLRQDV